MKKIYLINIIAVFCFCVLLMACGDKNSNSSVPKASKTLSVWDENSLSFSTSAIGGEGPIAYRRHPLLGPPQPGDQICTLNSKTYSYQKDTKTLKVTTCENILQEPRKIEAVLDQGKQQELYRILSSLVSYLRPHTGKETPACGGQVDAREWLQVSRSDGTMPLFYVGATHPSGKFNPRYPYGTLTDFNFLNQIEALLH